jgi:hypothetical protein
MYEIVNKGLNNLNGVFSGVTRHNIYKSSQDFGWLTNFLFRVKDLA